MIDLHCHSTASDGTVAPEILPSLAHDMGLYALALTDHDTVDGLHAFLEAGRAFPSIHFVPGVEFATSTRGVSQCHIVGLFINPDCEPLKRLCNTCCHYREQRNVRIVEKLQKLGYAITLDDVIAAKSAVNDVTGRPHIAAALIRKGYFTSPRDVFHELLGTGGEAYVKREEPIPSDVFNAIHAAGGLAIWAHPLTSSNMTFSRFERIAGELKSCGLDGLEAYYTEHTETQVEWALRVAKRRELLVSGGSDFHGDNQPGIHLGTGRGSLAVPNDVFDAMEQARNGLT